MSALVQMMFLPFVACLLMAAILGYLGIHVLKREVIFIDIAVAQVAAVGAIAAHLFFDAKENSLLAHGFSLACVLLISLLYSVARRRIVQISIEAVIGVSYAITAAAAMFLMGLHPGHVHAQEMLAGKLLWITWRHFGIAAVVFSAVGLCLFGLRRPLAIISEGYDAAIEKGLNVVWWDFLFYALLGVVITLAVSISGVVSVFAFLIIPATTSALFVQGWLSRMVIAWVTAAVASVAGILFSYYLDFSLGPAIALFLGILLSIAALCQRLRKVNVLGQVK
jgi:zinc/manganese transport system permease protein